MKKYNVQNYIRYKEDLKASMPEGLFWDEYTRDELIIKFMPLVENLARKFSTTQQASGVLSINDLIQIGGEALPVELEAVAGEGDAGAGLDAFHDDICRRDEIGRQVSIRRNESSEVVNFLPFACSPPRIGTLSLDAHLDAAVSCQDVAPF